MTIELAVLLSIISVAFAVYQGLTNLKRNNQIDTRNDVTQLTTVIVKLENISSGVTDIKNEISSIKTEVRETRERLVKLDESLKIAHKRIDELTKKDKIYN